MAASLASKMAHSKWRIQNGAFKMAESVCSLYVVLKLKNKATENNMVASSSPKFLRITAVFILCPYIDIHAFISGKGIPHQVAYYLSLCEIV
jgi:hypothetical protein